MKKTLHKSAALILLSAFAMAGQAQNSVPYTVDFTTQGMDGWYAFDANETGKTWNTDNAIKVPGYENEVKIPYFDRESGVAADDYFVSPAFTLKAGQAYAATFDVYQESGLGSFGSPLTLVVGTAKDNKEAFEKVADLKLSDDDNVVTSDRHVFTVAADGVYYIAAYTPGCEINEEYVYDGFTGMKLEETDEAPEVTIGQEQEEEEVKTVELPYSVVFDTTPEDWTIVDKSLTAGTTWQYAKWQRPGKEAEYGMGLQGDYGGGPNDYLISPAYKLENGKTYIIDMSYTTYQTGGNLQIELGTDIKDVSTFSTIATAQKNGNSYFPNDKFEFTVPEDGVYYIALHAVSNGTNNYAFTYVFDFALTEEVKATAIPYSASFDEETFDLPEGWTTIDNSVIAGSTWKKQGAPGAFETNHKFCVGMVSDTGNQPGKGGPNDYLVSPVFKLEGGKKYAVDLSYITYQAGGNLTIELGTDNTDASTFTTIATAQKDGNKYYPNDKFTFTAPEDGTYYVAMHVTSNNYYAYTYIFDFKLAEAGTDGINSVEKISADDVVNVYTIDGRLASKTADMSNLEKGTYIMTVKAADGTVKSFKIAK